MESYIKLYRRFLEWEWSDDPNIVSLFVHLLLLANYEAREWHGIIIQRGQLVTSLDRMSKRVGISVQTLRTCLSRLETTHEINKQTTNKYTIITICKYDSYQSMITKNEDETNKQPTNEQQTTNNQSTTTKEIKEINKNNIVENNACACVRARLEEQTINNPLWLNQAAMNLRTDNVMQLATEVMDEWELTNIPPEEYTAYHLLNHMRKKLEWYRKNNLKDSKEEWEKGLIAGAMQTINEIYKS